MAQSQSFTYRLLGFWMGWVLISGIPVIAAAAGAVATEGDDLLFARALRALGFDGSGVKVAVIADGANHHAAAAAAGELPTDLAIIGSCAPTATATCDMGTAMLEIIHDLAPGAELAIVALDLSLGDARFDLMRRMDEVIQDFGADIVVQAPRFFQEPYFEDGMLAQHVAQHVANGVLYVVGAGNEAERHYEADFTATSGHHLQMHDFGAAAGGASDSTMNVRIEPGQTLTAWLQWAEPFGGAGSDYDLLIRNETETATLAAGSDVQDGDDNPQEVAMFTNGAADAITVKLMVRKFAGKARRLELFVLGGPRIEEYGVAAGSIFGVAAAPGVMTVGAVAASAPDVIEPFSSQGPALITFPGREERQKPDIVAVDGVRVSESGSQTGQLVGVSAAAAHVAGLAALLRQALPTATAKELREAMMAGAVDLGEDGLDPIFGAGLAHALQAFDPSNDAPNGVIETPASNVAIEVGESVHFTATGEAPDYSLPLSFSWDFDGGALNTTQEDPGDVAFDRPGEFAVTLTVTDALGLSDATPATRQITVVRPGEPSNDAPNGVIDEPLHDVVIGVGDRVNFMSTGSDPDGPLPLSYRWDFRGAAPNLVLEDPGNVRFDKAGAYTVTLTVVDGLGLPDPTPATRLIIVRGSNQ